MTAWSERQRDNIAPALLAATALHAALLAALIWVHRPSLLPTGSSVPITLVASGPTTDSRPAIQAPSVQEAQAPAPSAEPPAPPPAPKEAAIPTPPKPAPSKPAPQPLDLARLQADVAARKRFSLAALQAEISHAAGAKSPHAAAAARRGPARPETAAEARVDAGTGVSQSDIAGLSELLQRLWNPDCSVDNRVIIPVRFTVGYDGRLQGDVDTQGRGKSSDPVVYAAARRAIDAVHEAAPYADTYRGLTITVRFDAKKACQERN
jgi:type IV secretory pathway VirB10-like protein